MLDVVLDEPDVPDGQLNYFFFGYVLCPFPALKFLLRLKGILLLYQIVVAYKGTELHSSPVF